MVIPSPIAAAGRKKPRLRLREHLRAYFIAGILVTGPVSLTLYLAWLFVDFVDSRVALLIPAHWNPTNYLPVHIPGLGLVTVRLPALPLHHVVDSGGTLQSDRRSVQCISMRSISREAARR